MRNDELAVTIDGHAGQSLVFAAEHAARFRHCCAEQRFAQRDRASETLRNRASSGRDIFVRVARQDSDGNRVFTIDETARNKFAVPRQDLYDSAGVLRNAARPQSVAVDPWMTCLYT
ncbi:MAG TPA: hypothetical protein VHO67_11360 [Polyangia bacterium]|nr:hypothetical protein [Polyangia bacterium]